MMKTSGRITTFCVALVLTLTSVSAVQRLNSIDDLKNVDFGQSVPRHSLMLLHWFANTVDIDNNNIIRLTFDPDNGDYGSHHYSNFEYLLDPLPRGHRYYTVGNLNRESSPRLPPHVIHLRLENEGGNRDRIVFRVRQQNDGRQPRIDQVYVTQHYETSAHQGTRYDPEHTYQVTANLLRQIREFSVEENEINTLTDLRDRFESNADDSQLDSIRNVWSGLANLGLLLFIVIYEKQSSNRHKKRRQPVAKRNTQRDFVVNIPESTQNHPDATPRLHQWGGITLAVTTGGSGKARILWRNVPRYRLRQGVMVVLYRNDDDDEVLTYKSIGNTESGSYDTSVSLNDGLQVRLHEVRKLCGFWPQRGEEIHRGDEFTSPEEVQITDYNAKLQLFVKDGKACARLYVKRSFSEWRSEFEKSWVGFYSSAVKATNNYEWWQWQWATKFKPNMHLQDVHYDVFEYHSGMAIAPGVQARFVLRDEVEKARTLSWRE